MRVAIQLAVAVFALVAQPWLGVAAILIAPDTRTWKLT